jgi:E1-E2 ATPase/Cation transporter/ATPase, N-terminus
MRVAANPSSARRRIGGQAQPAQLWVGAPAATLLNEVSRVPADTALNILVSDPRGLTDAEVDRRRKTYGPNAVVPTTANKAADLSRSTDGNPLEEPTLAFMGTSVLGGSATAVVVATGSRTYLGSLAKSVIGHRSLTSFDKGVNRVNWVLIRFMLVMVPVVFLINCIAKGDWVEAFLFATAVAVGLTPEMLPMVVTANLARGAVARARQKVIVKRLNAIQNFGAMDILCTDKTGTLTQDRIVLEEHLDLDGREDPRVLEFAYLNSYYQTGLKNLLDRAILAHAELEHELHIPTDYAKIDEVPFDFARRRMSVVARVALGPHGSRIPREAAGVGPDGHRPVHDLYRADQLRVRRGDVPRPLVRDPCQCAGPPRSLSVRMVHRRTAVADLDRAHDSHAENSLRPKRRYGASPALDDSGHRARHRSAFLTRGYGVRDGASAAVVFRVVGHDPPQLLGTDPTDKDLVHPAVQVVALTRRV